MAKVMGVGGVFFKSSDPAALAGWYGKWLNIELDTSFNGACFYPDRLPEKSYTVWSPFDGKTDYFQPSDQPFMVNLIVDDLPEALSQVSEGGATLIGEPEDSEFGHFGWFLDPDGNKVELWQPK
jgi:predicted enzyme related to lactoylglutathione lyase